MRLLWHSAAPWVKTGYGRVTREVPVRLHTMGHQVGIQAMASVRKDPLMWHGEVWTNRKWETPTELDSPITVFPSSSPVEPGRKSHFGVREAPKSFDTFGGDFYFTHFDTWMETPREIIPEMNIPYGSYVIVDHYPAPNAVVDQVQNADEVVAMSDFGVQALNQKGVRSRSIPHGVDTDLFKPIPEDHEDYPEKMQYTDDTTNQIKTIDLEDKFIFGLVAANHADRKHIPEMMQAFKHFIDRVDNDALLYLHTSQKSPTGFDLREVQREMRIPDENMFWASSDLYHHVGDKTLNQFYNMLDVMVNCSRGESWGLTITEAQSAGTPCIVTNFSSMPEQLGAGPEHDLWHDWMSRKPLQVGDNYWVAPHGLLVDPVVGITRERVSSKHFLCHPEDIFMAMKLYYEDREMLREHSDKCREFVVENYDWENNIVPAFNEMFNEVEERI